MLRSNGVYFFMSQVSVAAWPPAIHSSTSVSAVASSFLVSSAPRREPSRVAAPAAQPVQRKARREKSGALIVVPLLAVAASFPTCREDTASWETCRHRPDTEYCCCPGGLPVEFVRSTNLV